MRMEFVTRISNPYVLSMAGNGQPKLRLTSTQVIDIFIGSMFYPLMQWWLYSNLTVSR